MAVSYKVSPFTSPGLQNYIVRCLEADETGTINVTGAPGSVYAFHITGGSGQNYISVWDGTAIATSSADIVIPSGSGEALTVWVDKGITCSTAISFNASASSAGGSAPADSGNNLNLTLFIA